MAFRETLRILRDNKYGFAHWALETMAAFEQRMEDAARFLGLGDTTKPLKVITAPLPMEQGSSRPNIPTMNGYSASTPKNPIGIYVHSNKSYRNFESDTRAYSM